MASTKVLPPATLSTKVLLPSGGAAVTSTDDKLAIFFSLVRGSKAEDVHSALSVLVAGAAEDVDALADIFVLWFYTRDVRGSGKGERALAHDMTLALARMGYPETVARLVSVLPEFGSWRDVTALMMATIDAAEGSVEAILRTAATEALRSRLETDQKANHPSLAAKWAPREGSASNKAAALLATVLFPTHASAKKAYRKLVAGLNRKLNTPEVAMCDKRYRDLEPSHLPATCLKKSRHALLNELKPTKGKSPTLRFPDDEDRMACREKLLEVLARKTGKRVHGAAADADTLVSGYIETALTGSPAVADPVIEAQWADLLSTMQGPCEKSTVGPLVPVLDLSCSDASLAAAVALAVLASELTHPAFAGRVLTFGAAPAWVVLDGCDSLASKVTTLLAHRASSAVKDLESCVRMMLHVCSSAGVPANEVGELRLLIVSDMAFETSWASGAAGPWVTQHEALVKAFGDAGYDSLPSLVYWNVASKSLTKGEAYPLPRLGGGGKLVLELASDSSSILCGACLCYTAAGNHLKTVHYCDRSGLDGAVTHSGDAQLRGRSVHTITVQLEKLPETCDRLFFSLCACGPANLSAFQSPYVSLSDGAGSGNFCRYTIADAGTAPSALMAALVRHRPSGAWSVVALGTHAVDKCCMNYAEMNGLCAKAAAELALAGDGEQLSLPVAADTRGVELLAGFSAGMLRELIAPEQPVAAGAPPATPSEKLRAALRATRYDAVRAAVAEVGEGLLAGYSVPVTCVDCDEVVEVGGEDEEDLVVVE